MYILDIETFPNYFLVGIKNYQTKDNKTFECFEDKAEMRDLYNLLDRICKEGFEIVTFNGNHFDNVVLYYFYKNYSTLIQLTPEELTFNIWEFSQYVINHISKEDEESEDEYYQLDLFNYSVEDSSKKYRGDNFEIFKYYRYFPWRTIDLYCFWSKLIRQSKKISLKSLACTLGWREIQELPYKFNSYLNKEQTVEVKRYNVENDLGITDALTTRVFSQIEFRRQWEDLFGPKVLSMDGVAMGTDYVLQQIAEMRNVPFKELKKVRSYERKILVKDIIPRHVEFKHPATIDYYNRIEKDYSYRKHKIKGTVRFRNPDGTYLISDLGEGGIHSRNFNQYFKSDDKLDLIDIDVEALYPNLSANWSLVPNLFPEIAVILPRNIQRRNEVKHTNKSLSDLLKLGNNGLVGMYKNKHSPFFDAGANLSICLYGQFLILKLTERLIEEGINVYSQNTDGVTIGVPKGLPFQHIVDEISELFRVRFEETHYSEVFMLNVNNYLAVKTDGKLKAKGCFVQEEDKPLEDDHSTMVIPKVATDFLVNNIPIKENLQSVKDVTLFCHYIKCSKKFNVKWYNKSQQNINRVLPVTDGAYLYKTGGHLKEEGHLLEQSSVIMLNKLNNSSKNNYNINYRYFIDEVEKLTLPFKNNQTTLLCKK